MTRVVLGRSVLQNVCHRKLESVQDRPLNLGNLTVSFDGSVSEIFLPTSLFIHSSFLSPEPLDVIPGTTRGMVSVLCG